MVLGSLFDGSGGFPLAGAINGITPVWASEIEPYPIRVTKARFPNMKHLGSVLDVKGDTIEPVDIITFGSPCQDLSVAGKQLGIHAGERSNLFFEAVRIAKEMRNHDRATGRSGVDVRPRFLVWENVPVAFSSNQGEDFRSVLEALGGIAEDGVSIPRPPKGKWQHAGCVVGNGWSIAWRLYDAQYWGVPQRRKRIYLIADLASERAGEILFERESLCGHPAEGGEAWEGIAGDAQGGAGGSGFFEPASLMEENWRETPVSGALRAEASKSSHAVVWSFKGGQGPKAGSIGYQEEQSPTLTSANSGTNTVPDVVYPKVFDITGTSSNSMKSATPDSCFRERTVGRTLDTFVGSPECNQGGTVVVSKTCFAIDQQGGKGGANFAENVMPTLCSDSHGTPHGLVFAAGFSDTLGENAQGGMGYTEEGPPALRAGDVRSVVYDCRGNGDGLRSPTLTGDHQNRVTDYTAVCVGNGQLHQMSMAEQSNTLDCMHDQQAVLMQGNHPRKYIVRRLTPLECCRLQGFPDWWEDGVEGSDSARYKMWGNGIALPCAVDVLRRIAKTIKESENDEQR
jgi:DNA (cytosine-5)-methyltransferase 1